MTYFTTEQTFFTIEFSARGKKTLKNLITVEDITIIAIVGRQ